MDINLEEIEDCHNLLLLLATNCHNIMQQSTHATSNFEKVLKAQEICKEVVELLQGKSDG